MSNLSWPFLARMSPLILFTIVMDASVSGRSVKDAIEHTLKSMCEVFQ